jgi:farnesyl diphosphate synthase
MATSNSPLAPSTETALLDKSAQKLARRKRFEAVWPLIRDEVVAYLEQEKLPGEAVDWFKRVRVLRSSFFLSQ